MYKIALVVFTALLSRNRLPSLARIFLVLSLLCGAKHAHN